MLRRLLLRLYRVPRRPDHVSPTDLGLAAREVELTAVDGSRLHGWYLPAADGTADGDRVGSQRRPAVVLMHGWASAADDLLPTASDLLAAGLVVLAIDARGHGRSDTVEFMSMPRFAEDVEAAVAWLRDQPAVDPDRIALVGHSVGAGACLLAASRDPRIGAVVSIASMAHPREVITASFRRHHAPRPLVRAAVRTIERTIGQPLDSFAPVRTIGRIEAPVLVVHGVDDPTVSPTDAERLAAAGGPTASLRLVPGADHRTLDAFAPVVPAVVDFLRRALGPTVAGPRPATG